MRVIVVFLIAIGAVVLAPESALACSCARSTDLKVLEDSDVAFTGYVIQGRYPNDVANVNDTLGKIEWTFLPDTLIKGVDAGHVEVLSHSQGTACGVDFRVGGRYLVFAYEDKGRLETNSCNRTRAFSHQVTFASVEKVPGAFGPRSTDAQPSEEEQVWRWIVPSVAAVVLVAVARLMWRRRRHGAG